MKPIALLVALLAVGCGDEKEDGQSAVAPATSASRAKSPEPAHKKVEPAKPDPPELEPIEGPNAVFMVWLHSNKNPESRALGPRIGALQRRTRRPGSKVNWVRLDFSTTVSAKKSGIKMAKLRLVEAYMSVKTDGNQPRTGIVLVVDGETRKVVATLTPEQSDEDWAAAVAKAVGAKAASAKATGAMAANAKAANAKAASAKAASAKATGAKAANAKAPARKGN